MADVVLPTSPLSAIVMYIAGILLVGIPLVSLVCRRTSRRTSWPASVVKARDVSFTWTREAVSYTHLDVYKRQMYAYYSIPEKYKKRWVERHDEPEKQMRQEMIRNIVKKDEKAENFFEDYRYDKNLSLIHI